MLYSFIVIFGSPRGLLTYVRIDCIKNACTYITQHFDTNLFLQPDIEHSFLTPHRLPDHNQSLWGSRTGDKSRSNATQKSGC